MSTHGRFIVAVVAVIVAFVSLTAVSAEPARPAASSRIHIPMVATNLTGLQFAPVVTGLRLITDIANAGDERLFVTERDGRIHIIYPDGRVSAHPFLDLSNDVSTQGPEQGLLGLAFHPDFANNGLFYVAYNPRTQPFNLAPLLVARFAVDPQQPDFAVRNSKSDVLSVGAAGPNHQGGSLRFAADGTLFVGVGEGGNGQLAQDTGTLRGKILRIDIGPYTTAPYRIPPGNPFTDTPGTRPEIWATGVRNPFHLAVDPAGGNLFIADVGASNYEEVNVIGDGGHNLGWPCVEGPLDRDHTGCEPRSRFTLPVFAYHHQGVHCAIIGGEVYRGDRFPAMEGHYFFGDFCSGAFWMMSSPWTSASDVMPGQPWSWTAAGKGADGEVYFAAMTTTGGTIFHLVPGG